MQTEQVQIFRDTFNECPKKDTEGFVLANEYAGALIKKGLTWDKFNEGTKFLPIIRKNPDLFEIKVSKQSQPLVKMKAEIVIENGAIEQADIANNVTANLSPLEVLIDEAIGRENIVNLSPLEIFIRDYDRIFIDTCSIMRSGGEIFLKNAKEIFSQYGKKLIVLNRVYGELHRINEDPKHKRTETERKQAGNAINLLQEYNKNGLIEIFGQKNEQSKTADDIFLQTFEKFGEKYKLALITRDHKLSNKILELNKNKKENWKRCSVFKLDNKGNLEEMLFVVKNLEDL